MSATATLAPWSSRAEPPGDLHRCCPGRGEEWRELALDDLLADCAEGVVQCAHAAVELGAVRAAVVVVGALERADGPWWHGTGLRIALSAVRILRCRHWRRGQHEVMPFDRVAIAVDRDVRLRRLSRWVVVVSHVDSASGVVLVLIRKAESGVAHLMQPDLHRVGRKRESRNGAARSTVDRRVDDHHRHVELRHLCGGNAERGCGVHLQEPLDAVVAEAGIEVGSGRCAAAAAGGRIVCPAVGGGDVDAKHVDCVLQSVERSGCEDSAHKSLCVVRELAELRGLVTVAHDHQVPALGRRPVGEDLGPADYGPVGGAHLVPGSSADGRSGTRRSSSATGRAARAAGGLAMRTR